MSVSFRRASFGSAAVAVLAVAVAGVLVSGSSGSVAATGGDLDARTITVSGAGQASGTPDVVRLDIGVQRTGKDVNVALSAASDDIRRIKEALARHGVKDADIQTSQLSINQHYGPIQTYESKGMPAPAAPMSEPAVEPVASDAPDDPGVPRTREDVSSAAPEMSMPPMPGPEGPNGYDVFQSLSVKLRNLDDAGAAISDAAAAGGNATRINGVSFEFSDSDALLEDARERAFAAAKEKAEQYADLAGGSLGKVVSISEGNSGGGGYPYPMAAQDAGGSKAVPFYPGSQQVEVTATVVWELN